MFLTEPINPDPNAEGEQRKIYVVGERKMLGQFYSVDSYEPVEVKIPRLAEDPNLKIKFIYSSNEKCVVVDSQNGMTIWGRDFSGFYQRDPITF